MNENGGWRQLWLHAHTSILAGESVADRCYTVNMILIRSTPILRRLFDRKLTREFVGHAPAWRPYLWHNPHWTRIRIGSRRHHLAYASSYLYRRMTRGWERHGMRARRYANKES